MAKMSLLNFVAAAISISSPALGNLLTEAPAPKKPPVKTVKPVVKRQSNKSAILVQLRIPPKEKKASAHLWM